MSEATHKSPAINWLLSDLMGRSRVETIAQNKCMSCGKQANNFRDNLSRKEYTISGLCQVCQDELFRKEEE